MILVYKQYKIYIKTLLNELKIVLQAKEDIAIAKGRAKDLNDFKMNYIIDNIIV